MVSDIHEGLDGPDPSIFDEPTGRKDFLFDSAKLVAAAAAAGPFYMAASQAEAEALNCDRRTETRSRSQRSTLQRSSRASPGTRPASRGSRHSTTATSPARCGADGVKIKEVIGRPSPRSIRR